jgi:hypothetical protein
MYWKYYILLYKNGKMKTVKSIPSMGENKGEWCRGSIQLQYIVKVLVSVTM